MRVDYGPFGPGIPHTNEHGDPYWSHRLTEAALKRPPAEPAVKSAPRADLETLDRVYRALLSDLSLSSAHRENLRSRGLTDPEIAWRGYRSAPREAFRIADRLVEKFGAEVCSRVPGVVQGENRKGRYWTLSMGPGLVIPVLTGDRHIAALRIRRDKPNPDGERYYWLSSGAEKWGRGPSPGAPIHVSLPSRTPTAGDPCAGTPTPQEQDDGRPWFCCESSRLLTSQRVRITEGELKADTANVLSDVTTISIPGVGHWEKAIPALRALAAETILLAFDQEDPDDPKKAGARKVVARALRAAVAGLQGAGFSVSVETWRYPQGKGIDDLLASGNRPEVVAGEAEVQQLVETTAAAAGLPRDPKDLLGELRASRRAEDYMTDGALAAAAHAYAQLPAEWQLTRDAAKAAGVDMMFWQKTVRQRVPKDARPLQPVQEGDAPRLRRLSEALADPPAHPELVVPPGYQLSERGIVKVEKDQRVTPIASAPVIAIGRMDDVSDGTEAMRLAWLRDGHWKQHTADRLTCSDTRQLVTLAARGCPVNSLSAGDLVAYLTAYEAVNLERLPRARVARKMGWQGRAGELGFLWGRTLLRGEGDLVEGAIEQLDPRQWTGDGIWFRGADEGEEQMADGFHSRGTFEGWADAAALAVPYPRVLLALYVALATPLLQLLEAHNFVVDWSYETSTGKTTTLKLGASCWGLPDERADAAALTTWDNTRVWTERASAVLSGIPLILDDTKRAKKREDVGNTIYEVCSGRGRGRGSVKGLRRSSSWRTILMSTGEAPATTFTTDGGAVARVLTLWGLPFESKDAAGVVHQLDLGLRRNYGHAGPRFVRWLLQRRNEWEAWQRIYDRLHQDYLKRATTPVVGRLSAHAALLELTAMLANQALELPWAPTSVMEPLWEAITTEARERDRPAEALHYVMSWARSNYHAFWGRHEIRKGRSEDVLTQDPIIPHGGWAGYWDIGDAWEFIGFATHRLTQLLEQGGFEPDPITRAWHDRGWLSTDSEKGRTTKRLRIHNIPQRLTCIKRAPVEALQGREADPTSKGGTTDALT